MAQKTHDLACKTGEYVDNVTGETKGRWKNVGAKMRGDDGNEFFLLDRSFNPAGIPNPQDKESVLISIFETQQRGQQGQQAPQQRPGNNAQGYANASRGGQQTPPPPTDDDLPPDWR